MFNVLKKKLKPPIELNHLKPTNIPLKWYSCGPTVYSDTHLGHLRSYISFDIIRRILEYSSQPVHMNMNITDIDDKIIIKSQETDTHWRSVASEFEHNFFSSMAAFNVIPPTTITRVSDYIPEMMDFIDRISSNGFAYESNGSIYFDYIQFSKTYTYGKSLGQKPITGDGGTKSLDKRDPKDFVLWKAAKPNEISKYAPSWNYKGLLGRPGWHIECSAMSHAIFGDHIDIHSGGVDLKFPHHCNEVAQTQAALKLDPDTEWCSHWLHSGHLHIQGHKMSKSLKNFVSVPEYLNNLGYTPNQFRMFCLLHKFDSNIEWSKDRMKDASNRLSSFSRALNTINKMYSENPESHPLQIHESETRHLDLTEQLGATTSPFDNMAHLNQLQVAVLESLRNEDFNTPKALNNIESILSWATQLSSSPENYYSLYSVHSWVSHLFSSVFGLYPFSPPIGSQSLANLGSESGSGSSIVNTDIGQSITHILETSLKSLFPKLKKLGFSNTPKSIPDDVNLMSFSATLRSQVRKFALESDPKNIPLLETIDTFRDLVLVPNGYQVKDEKDFSCEIERIS